MDRHAALFRAEEGNIYFRLILPTFVCFVKELRRLQH